MGSMKNTGTTEIGAHTAPEQLTLLTITTPPVPLQFRLDERTRRSGLRHVAELRAQIAAQAANRDGNRDHQHASRRAA